MSKRPKQIKNKNKKVLAKRKKDAASVPAFMLKGAAARGSAFGMRNYKNRKLGRFGPASPCIVYVTNGKPTGETE